MNKKLLAIAVASAIAAPMAANASDVTIYGKMHYSWDFIDTHDAANDGTDDATGVTRASRLGFKGSEDLGDGMKAVYQIETGINGNVGSRNTFVGLAGGFGTVVMGRHDTPYKISTGSLDIFADTIADYNGVVGNVNGSIRFDERVPQTVAYITPDFSGFTGAIARVSAKVNEGAGAEESNAWSMAGMYKNGPLFGALAYQTVNDGALAFSAAGIGSASAVGTNDKSKAWKLGLGYDFGMAKVGFVYEKISSENKTVVDKKDWLLNAAVPMGNNTIKFEYGRNGDNANVNDTGSSMWALGVDHKFSKRTSVYALYAAQNNDRLATYGMYSGDSGVGTGAANSAAGNDVTALSVGIVHNF